VYSMGVREFTRRFKNAMNRIDCRFAFFLGSGCSVSSGIPAAGTLVRNWLPRLKEVKTGSQNDTDQWVRKAFPQYQKDRPALLYGEVVEAMFSSPQERQIEIERLTDGIDPGFGYAVLAQVMCSKIYGRHCNVALTTNFDDLLADALYLYTNKKPLVIYHESLVGFATVSRSRPLVIKLHGDARLAPRNTELETMELDEGTKRTLKNLLSEMGLVFVGYGGNDRSIVNILDSLPGDALPWGLYWIGERVPDNDMGTWLRKREAKWVRHKDFDELMLLIFNEFGLEHPEWGRFRSLHDTYIGTFKRLSTEVEAKPETTEKRALRRAVHNVAGSFQPWLSLLFRAEALSKTDVEQADKTYQKALRRFPENIYLLGSYAVFLAEKLRKPKQAELYFKKAVEVQPDNAANLANYAVFLQKVAKDFDAAEQMYRNAIELDPTHAYTLSNYAVLLTKVYKDYDTAERYFKKAIELDPRNIDTLRNYAGFLVYARKRYDKAEDYFNEALDLDPSNVDSMCNYAVFLWNVRRNFDKAEKYFKKGTLIEPDNIANLGHYAIFLMSARRNYRLAEKYFEAVFKKDPDNPRSHGGYAILLMNIRMDYDRAEEYFERAVELDPHDPGNLGNYAVFLTNIRANHDGAQQYLEKAFELDPDNGNTIGIYAHFLANVRNKHKEAEELFKEGIKADPNNALNLANYAGFLLARGRHEEGMSMLYRALGTAVDGVLLLECFFYQYAHDTDPHERRLALDRVKELTTCGARSPGWSLRENVKRATTDGHENPEFLATLARVISAEIELEELKSFELWSGGNHA